MTGLLVSRPEYERGAIPYSAAELSYQLMYVESNGKSSPHDPWSFRQTGAHHKHSVKDNSHRMILLHPNDRAIAQSRLKGHAQSCRRAALANHPLNVHLMVLSSYLINWQDYIESLAKELETIVSVLVEKNGVAEANLA
jgi:hypothetical protein